MMEVEVSSESCLEQDLAVAAACQDQQEFNKKFIESVARHLPEWKPSKSHLFTNMEEQKSDKFVCEAMDRFLTDSYDPDDIYRRLKESDAPAQLCGRAFRAAEPTYSCRDCGLDPSCVLCMQCFDKSVHKKHKYRMSTSNGGGYCDCGDPSAWKSSPACSDHAPSPSSQKYDPVKWLPKEIKSRAEKLFLAIINYSLKLLTVNPTSECDIKIPEYDQHHVVLYNDEVHTYEQVIKALEKAVNCSKKAAQDLATVVDREGRTTVFTGQKQKCEDIATSITARQRLMRTPLKVHVLSRTVINHQQCALHLLQWLDRVIIESDGLRVLFCELAMNPREGVPENENWSILEQVFILDVKFWKTIRDTFHKLFMSGVFKDQSHKTRCAQLFTEHYKRLYKDFITDDHYRSVSVTSLSVQMYTVPSIARKLLAENGLMTKIVEVVTEAAQKHIPKDMKHLKFPRNADLTDDTQPFKRALYALIDLKYALQCGFAPIWTDKLRTSIKEGVKVFLDLLCMVQNMDSSRRFTTSHIEFEPEWETAFNIQIKIHSVLSLIIEWCKTDREVWQGAVELVLDALQKTNTKFEAGIVSVGSIKTVCSKYMVGDKENATSLHLPLHRILTGFIVSAPDDTCTEFVLDKINKKGNNFLLEIIDLPLNVITMLAQVHADMWKRNGFSILNQIFYYHNVRCREEMYDRDIQLLQICAANMNPDHFLIRLICKFDIHLFISAGDSKKSVFHQTILDEFIRLIITLLSERYVLGVGEITHDDIVQREIIHQLAITRMSHSDLDKNLIEDANRETNIEDNVLKVADFSRSRSDGKGMYVLKTTHFDQFNPLFYHYTKTEQSKAEIQMRSLKKHNKMSSAFIMPCPPRWTERFSSICRIYTSDTFVRILLAALPRGAVDSSNEPHIEKVLHLITLVLHEERMNCERGDKSLSFIQKSHEKMYRYADAQKTNEDKTTLYDDLIRVKNDSSNLTEPVQELLNKTLEYFNQISSLNTEGHTSMMGAASCSVDKMDLEKVKQDREKQDRSERAARRRDKIVTKMAKLQRKFLKENSALFKCTSSEIEAKPSTSGTEINYMDTEEFCEYTVALGVNRNSPQQRPSEYVCMLCQEVTNVSDQNSTHMLYPAYIQRSTVLSSDRSVNWKDYIGYANKELSIGNYVSTCGHPMHVSCWKSYHEGVITKESRRAERMIHGLLNQAFDYRLSEYLCPLCETIANTTLPVLPCMSYSQKNEEKSKGYTLSYDEWLTGLIKLTDSFSTPDSFARAIASGGSKPLIDESSAVPQIAVMAANAMYTNFLKFGSIISESLSDFRENLEPAAASVMTTFLLTNMNVMINGSSAKPNNDQSIEMMEKEEMGRLLWNTTAYTIKCIESLLSADNKPLFGHLAQRHETCSELIVRLSSQAHHLLSLASTQQYCMKLLSHLLEPSCSCMPELADTDKSPSICPYQLFNMDLWSLLVSLTFSLPSVFAVDDHLSIPTGSSNEQFIVQTIVSVYITQQILSYSEDPTQQEQDTEMSDSQMEEDTEESQLCKLYYNLISNTNKHTKVNARRLYNHVINSSLSFLRCAALLFRHITDVREPSRLLDRCEAVEEYEVICRYLSLPTQPSQLFTTSIFNIIQKHLLYLRQPITEQLLKAPESCTTLIPLPQHYSDLINESSQFNCPRSKFRDDESRTPTLCLVCGTMVCSQSYCCQVEVGYNQVIGAASHHAQTCGAGNGIFLRVRHCQVLLLSGKNKGSFLAAPYVDEYGETDHNLKRGNPLFLSKTSYSDLHRLWLSNAIPDKVSRTIYHALPQHYFPQDWSLL